MPSKILRILNILIIAYLVTVMAGSLFWLNNRKEDFYNAGPSKPVDINIEDLFDEASSFSLTLNFQPTKLEKEYLAIVITEGTNSGSSKIDLLLYNINRDDLQEETKLGERIKIALANGEYLSNCYSEFFEQLRCLKEKNLGLDCTLKKQRYLTRCKGFGLKKQLMAYSEIRGIPKDAFKDGNIVQFRFFHYDEAISFPIFSPKYNSEKLLSEKFDEFAASTALESVGFRVKIRIEDKGTYTAL
jgi:hypothetical protein